jgi:tRNA U34 5-methylaminomethyl-2-thiouridine-forming methyltransferase MnmC
LKKLNTLIQDHQFIEDFYDVIYYDAFAPSCQPDLWTEGIHQSIYQSLRKDGVFVTYCAQGNFKRLLKEIGYQLESLPGPAKKKEMTRAVKR